MSERDIATPTRTAEIIKQYDLRAKKSLGQNFLVEPNILTRMLQVAEVDQQTDVIEVGPGIGALTQRLAREARQVLAFEIDDRLIPVLSDVLSAYDNVCVKHQDILATDLTAVTRDVFGQSTRLVVVANLPYYITTPIIMRFIESGLPFDALVMMMQKEVAERLTAQVGTKAYGSLTIALQYHMTAEIAFTVPRTVFQPQPNIDSAILKLTRREKPLVSVADEPHFFNLVRAAFVQRRKTLWNNLTTYYGKDDKTKNKLTEALAVTGISPTIRAEAMTIAQFAALSNALVAG